MSGFKKFAFARSALLATFLASSAMARSESGLIGPIATIDNPLPRSMTWRSREIESVLGGITRVVCQ